MPSDRPFIISRVSVRGQFYVRLEHDQWTFARERAAAYDGAIVPARYGAPYPPGHPSFGQDPSRLASAVVGVRKALVIEPDTPALCSRGVVRYPSATRLRATAAATAVELPLTVDQLKDSVRRDAFVDASMQDQRLARAVAGPHLEFRSATDARLELNLVMLRRTVASAGTQVPIAFIQVTRTRLLGGVVAEVAPQYAATGIRRVFLRVREVGEDMSASEFEAYLEVIDAFVDCGVDLVADCVGRVGPLLVHEGALGFSSGGMFHRRVAKPLLASGGGNGGAAVSIESPHGWSEIARDSEEAASVASCPVAGCRLVAPDVTLDDIREHRLHTLRRRGLLAVDQDTAELIRELRATGQSQARELADVLAVRHRRAA